MSGEDNSNNEVMMELMKSMFSSMSNQFNTNMSDMNNNINNNMNSLREDIINNNEVVNARFESLQERIASRAGSHAVSPSTLAAKLNTKVGSELVGLAMDSPRASSRVLSSRHLAVTLTAIIPVVIVPTVLKTPPLCLTVPGIESSPSYLDPPLSVTSITVLGSPESLETVIKVAVRTSGSIYDITPTVESSHATEELPMNICPDMDTVEHNEKNSVILCDFHDQLSHCTVLGEQYIFL